MRSLVVLVAWLLLASAASAQTTFNPSTVEIVPSSDYNVQMSDGTNLTTGVRVQYFLQGVNPTTGSPVMVVDLCKPPLNTAGKIVVNKSACTGTAPLFASPLLTNTSYFATSTQYGPGGESGRSPASNPFVLSGAPQAPLSTVVR